MSIASEIQRIKNNIAAAYSACESKGADLPQLKNSNNLADTIAGIPQGTGNVEVEPKYVNFIDSDGTILYSYTESETQALTALPPLPTAQGYIYQSWNWTLADIKANGFPLTVGAVRIPSDGKTHLTFDLLDGDNLTLTIPFRESSGREITIDWGDGASGIYTASPAEHTYADCGRYVVCADANDSFRLNTLSSSTAIRLVKVDLGERFGVNNSTFFGCLALEEVSVPQNVTTFGTSMFSGCCSIKSITVPSPFGEIGAGSFEYCTSIKSVSLPKSVSQYQSGCFSGSSSLRTIMLPVNIGKINDNTFRSCKSLQSINIPPNINQVGANAFNDCSNLRHIDLSAKTSVPALSSVSAFSGISSSAVFYVRNAEMLAAFQSATNWSTFANKMQIGGKYADS